MPKVIDFTAPAEEAVVIKFPDGSTAELPTVDALSLSALQFLTAQGDEWFTLFQKPDLTDDERTRFGHLNVACIKSLLPDVAADQIDALTDQQKAAIIVSFMTASPDTAETLQKLVAGEAALQAARHKGTGTAS